MKHVSSLVRCLALFGALGFVQANAQERGQHGQQGPPPLSDAQQACLQAQGLPPPGSGGARPSREQVKAAFEKCGIQKPPHAGPPPEQK